MLLGHRKLSAWYQQLAQHLEAGIPLADALRTFRGGGARGRDVDAVVQTLEAGGSVDAALRSAIAWLPEADILALSAAAHAGRMPRMLHNLSARHAELGAAKLRILLACAYPLGILHFGLLLLPVVRMIDWEKGFHWSGVFYAQSLALTFLPLWIAGLIVWILARRGSPVISGIARFLPALRGYVRAQRLSDFSFTLGNLLEAGVPIGPAWASAGLVTRSRDLQAAAQAMESSVARGEAPGVKLGAWPCFPADFVALYRTGEATGQLDANLLRLAAQNQAAAHRALTFATVLYPALMFLSVAGLVGYFVISIYGNYLKMLEKIGS